MREYNNYIEAMKDIYYKSDGNNITIYHDGNKYWVSIDPTEESEHVKKSKRRDCIINEILGEKNGD